MIIHCSRKLAAKLTDVSSTPLQEASPLGSWHAHMFTLDHRQCVLFVHDTTRYALFLAGLRKEHFSELGSRWFRVLFTASLAAFGCPDVQIKKVDLALGPVRYDTSVDRSVQGSLRVAKQDLEAWLYKVPNVMELDPVTVSCDISRRPTSIYGKWLWPDKEMMKLVEQL